MSLLLFTVFSMSYLSGNGKGDPDCCGGHVSFCLLGPGFPQPGNPNSPAKIPTIMNYTAGGHGYRVFIAWLFFSTCKYHILYFTSVKISIKIRFELDTGHVPTGVFVTETRNASASFSVHTQTHTGVIFHFKTLLVARLKCLKYSAFRF